MNTIRLQLRFLVPLVLTLVAAAYLALAMIFRLLFAGLYQLVFARR